MRRSAAGAALCLLLVAGCSTAPEEPPAPPGVGGWEAAPPGQGAPQTLTPETTDSEVNVGDLAATTADYITSFSETFFTFDIVRNSGRQSQWANQIASYTTTQFGMEMRRQGLVTWWRGAMRAGASARDATTTTTTRLWATDDGTSMWRVDGTHELVMPDSNTILYTAPYVADIELGSNGRISAVTPPHARNLRPPATETPTPTAQTSPSSEVPDSPYATSPSADSSSSVPSATPTP